MQFSFSHYQDFRDVFVQNLPSYERLKKIFLAAHIATYLVELEQSSLEDANELLDALSDEVSYLLGRVDVCVGVFLGRALRRRLTLRRSLALAQRVARGLRETRVDGLTESTRATARNGHCLITCRPPLLVGGQCRAICNFSLAVNLVTRQEARLDEQVVAATCLEVVRVAHLGLLSICCFTLVAIVNARMVLEASHSLISHLFRLVDCLMLLATHTCSIRFRSDLSS